VQQSAISLFRWIAVCAARLESVDAKMIQNPGPEKPHFRLVVFPEAGSPVLKLRFPPVDLVPSVRGAPCLQLGIAVVGGSLQSAIHVAEELVGVAFQPIAHPTSPSQSSLHGTLKVASRVEDPE
jgi:hypothetical protein